MVFTSSESTTDRKYGQVTFSYTVVPARLPAAPTIAECKCKEGKNTVAGSGEAGCTVIVTVNNSIYSGTIGSSGAYSVYTGTLKKGDKITVQVKDKFEMLSGATSATVLGKPKLKSYKAKKKVIKGKASKNTTVVVKVGKKKYTVKCKKGTFTVKLKKKLKKKAKISAWSYAGWNKTDTASYRLSGKKITLQK